MEPIAIVSLTIWITLLIYPIFGVLIYQRRDFYPINGRYPRMSLLESFAIFLLATNTCFYALNLSSCNVFNTIVAFCSIFFWTGFNYRLLVLLFNYEITKNLTELQDHRKFQDWTPSWYYQHRYLIKPKFWIGITVRWILLFCVIFIYLRVTICDSLMYRGVFGIQGTLGLLTSCFLCYKIWGFPQDNFGLKNEFKGRVIPPFIMLVIFAIVAASNQNLASETQNVGLLLTCHPVLFFSLIPPYFQSLRVHHHRPHRPRRSAKRSPSEIQSVSATIELISLEAWLSRQEGITLFLNYLKTEFSTENLYFYLEVINYKQNSNSNSNPNSPSSSGASSGAPSPISHHDLLDRCLQIYNKYVNADTAPSPITLSFEVSELTRKGIRKFENLSGGELEKVPLKDLLGVFDAAQQEIYQLMNSDSFYRFQKTASFLDARDRVLAGPILPTASPPRDVEADNSPTHRSGSRELLVGVDVVERDLSPIRESRATSPEADRMGDESSIDMSLSGRVL